MASINGLTLKKMVSFKGHEGEPLVQGDLHYHGKKVGYYSQDSRGGEDDIQLPDEVVMAFATYTNPNSPKFKGVQWAIYDLVDLTEMEKQYKSCVRKGGLGLVDVVKNGFIRYSVILNKYLDEMTDEQIKINLMTNPTFSGATSLGVTVYRDIKQFTVGE